VTDRHVEVLFELLRNKTLQGQITYNNHNFDLAYFVFSKLSLALKNTLSCFHFMINCLLNMETNCENFLLYNIFCRPPPWFSGESSWLQIQGSGFNSQCYQIFREAVGLERGPLILLSTIEELLGRKSSGSSLQNQHIAVGIRDADHVAPSIRKSWH
jgi:hypothetical protein